MTRNISTLRQKVLKVPLYRISALAVSIAVSSVVNAEDQAVEIDIDKKLAGPVLLELGRKTNSQIMLSPGIGDDVFLPAIKGSYTLTQALDLLLDNSGLVYEVEADGRVLVKKSGKSQKSISSEKNNYDIEEVIVSASRRDQELQDVPMSLTVVNTEEFVSAGLTNIGDIIAYTPGFNFSNTAGFPGSGGTITARGVAYTGNTPVVGIYVDDVPLSSNSPWGTGSLFGFDGLLGDIERVELLKGPQGTLYGATSVGGAVKYITRKPSLDEIRGQVKVDLSDTREGGLNKIYSARVSMPLIEDRLGVSLAGFDETNDGYIDRVETGTGAFVSENQDNFERNGFSGDLLFKITDRFDFRGRVLKQKSHFSGTSIVDMDKDTLEPLYGAFSGDEALASNDVDNTYYSATFEYQFDGATLNSTSSYVDDEWASFRDIASLLGALTDVLENNPPGTTTSIPFSISNGSKKYIQEIRLTSEANDHLEWFVGLYYADEKTFNTRTLVSEPTKFNWLDFSGPSQYEEYATFGNLTWYVTPDFDLTGGVRISKHSMDLQQEGTGALIGEPISSSAGDTVDTWMFAARYRPSQDMSLYARVASGYRPASANLPVINPITGENFAPFIAADNLWMYEIGAKGTLADRLFSYDLSLWYMTWDDFQTFILFSDGAGGSGNAQGGITGQGMEGTFTIYPFDDFSIVSTFAYTDSTLNEDEPLVNGLAGQQVPYVPEWTASTRARYDFILSSGLNAHVSAGFSYSSSSRSDFTDDGAYIPGVSDPVADGPFDNSINIPTDSYVLADLNAGITNGKLSLNVYITNLLDKYAIINTSGSAGAAFNLGGVPLHPRTVGVVLSYDF